MLKPILKYKKQLKHTLKSMLKDKKKLTYAIIMTVLVIIVIAETTIILRSSIISNNTNQTISDSGKPQADHLKAMAIEALADGKTTQAKALFQEARRQYEYIGDTNNVIDTNAQLCMLGEAEYCHAAAN